MFSSLLSSLRDYSKNDAYLTRRRHDRRHEDRCVCVIGDASYPVINWSLGGLLLYGDSRPFGVDNEIDVTLRFKMRDSIVEVPHKARVVRKSKEKIAFEFMPLNAQIRKTMQNVIDDFVTSRFADSQLV